MSRFGEASAALAGGAFGVMLLAGSVKSLMTGGVTLRRYSAPLDQAWPIVLVLFVLGTALLALSLIHLVRMAKDRTFYH